MAEDQTDMMVDIMQMELDKFSKIETKFVAKFSQQDYDWITKGWKVKVGRCTRGEQVGPALLSLSLSLGAAVLLSLKLLLSLLLLAVLLSLPVSL